MVDVAGVKLAISKDTIMVVGSYPNMPYGIIDPIDKLSEIVGEYNGRIGLYVDTCLGGNLVPFISSDCNVPMYGFQLPGVTSLSVNISECASILLYRDSSWRRYQYPSHLGWVGVDGMDGAPNMLGCYPKFMVAAAWISIMKIGRRGYINQTRDIVDLTRSIIGGIREVGELQIIGDPQLNVVAFNFKESETMNVYDLSDEMKARGWYLRELQCPAALHLCTNDYMHIENLVSAFIGDLKASISDLKENGNHKTEPKYGSGHGPTATVYTAMQSVPNYFTQLYFDVSNQYSPKVKGI
jgi:sphinganine-1-phosphate aldolase